MPKNKPHKGLLKRVRVTKNGKVKLQRAFGRHLRSHKSGKLLRSYRRSAFVAAPEIRRMRSLLLIGNGKRNRTQRDASAETSGD